jgi:hypothetical protein
MAPPWTEEDVQKAIYAITKGMSILKAMLEYGVPRSTLQDRINGALSK